MRALPFLWLLGLLSISRLVRAAEPQNVRAVVAGDPAVVARVIAVLRPSLEQHGLRLAATQAPHIAPRDAIRFAQEPTPDSPVAYLWLDLTAKPPSLILVEAKTRLVYAQALKVHASPDDVETELIRYVVDQSLDAILSGSAPTVTAKEFERSLAPAAAAPEPAAEPRPARPARDLSGKRSWAFSAGYSLSALAADAIQHGPELGWELRVPHLQLKLHAVQRLPLRVTRDEASVRSTTSGARLLAASPFALGRGLAVSVGAGVGLDVTRVSPAAEGAVPAFWVSDPLLLAQAAVEQAWGAVLLSAHAGAEWDWVAARYTITRSGGPKTVWTPSRVRPCAGLTFGYAF